MIEFGIYGVGWRAEFFLRVAAACPEYFRVVGIMSRDPGKAVALGERFHVPAYSSMDNLVQIGRPQFVVTSVTRGANLGLLAQFAALNMPVLSETPPAETVEELARVWDLVQMGAVIHVAEQYWLQPHHAARLAFAHSGKLGRVTQAQVSFAHGYHGISMMRRFLKVLYEPVTVSAYRFDSPLVEGPGRDGPSAKEALKTSQQTFARFDFGDRLGIYDFTGDQYFSFVRGQRLLVRGERGEIVDERAVYLKDHQTPIQVTFARQVAGANGNLEGYYLKGIQAGEEWVYRNPLIPGRLSDEEIAIGSCLLRMAETVRSGADFYPAAEACQDRYLEILMEQAWAQGEPVKSQPQPWHT